MLPFVQQNIRLLNRDLALHAKSKVRSAVERILAGLDVGERNRNRLARIDLQCARELPHLLGDVRIELTLNMGLPSLRLGLVNSMNWSIGLGSSSTSAMSGSSPTTWIITIFAITPPATLQRRQTLGVCFDAGSG